MPCGTCPTHWTPYPGAAVMLRRTQDYAEYGLGLYTVLEVLAVRGRMATIRHDPSFGPTDGRTGRVQVRIDQLRSVLHCPHD